MAFLDYDPPITLAQAQEAVQSLPEPPEGATRIPWFLSSVRHVCADGIPRGLSLKERYVLAQDGLAVLYKDGRCHRCGKEFRSWPRVVVAAQRPPMTGRVAR